MKGTYADAYALHIGLRGESTASETLAPQIDIASGRLDLADLRNGDGEVRDDQVVTLEGQHFANGQVAGFIVVGSWQEWGEPTAEVDDWHLVLNMRGLPTAEAVRDALLIVRSCLHLGRTFDYAITSDPNEWSEHQRVWTDDGQQVMEVAA